MKTSFKTGAHTKHRLLFHLVFVPKYRKKVLRYDVARRLRELIWQGSQINDWRIHKLEILPDHVHLLLQINPVDAIDETLKRIKGGTSRVIRQEFPELEEFLWGDSLWCDGYFAETVGRTTETAIRKYLDSQRLQTEAS
jgi:putative transposase